MTAAFITTGVTFPDRLASLVEERASQIVLGLDPDSTKLWPGADRVGDGSTLSAPERAAAAVAEHCKLAIAAAGPYCVAVKPQLACFEKLGWHGWRALTEVVAVAHAAGLLVLADGKRGDVPVTAQAYGQALVGSTETPWGGVQALGADAFTANPLLGKDSLEPLVQAAVEANAGCFVLARTSNPGASDVQDLALAGVSSSHPSGDTEPQFLYERLAAMINELGQAHVGPASGLSAVGAVVGATQPQHIVRMRQLMPAAIFLLPGIGAQGGQVEDLAPAFGPGRAAALITASRSIVNAYDVVGATAADAPQAAAEAADKLRQTAWALSA